MPRFPWEEDEDLTVGEIKDADVREASAVDRPATARRFAMFKSALKARKEGFTGIYGAEGVRQTGGSSSELVDLERCLANNPDADPAFCEAMAAAGGLDDLLEPDMSGDDAEVSDPATSGDFMTAGKQGKPGAVDDCVAAILEDPAFDAGEYPTPEERAWAICQSQFGRLGGPAMPRKQGEMPVMDGEPEAPAAVEVTEVPSTPEEWPFAQCVSDAVDKGMGDEDAAAVCMMLRERFGNPSDPNIMLVPEGLSTDTLLMTAGIDLGLIKPAGAGEPAAPDAPPAQANRLPAKNHWLEKLDEMLGRKRQKTQTEKALAWLRKEVVSLQSAQAEQVKKNADLLRIIEGLHRMLGAALGVPLESGLVDEETPAGPEQIVEAMTAPAPEPKRAKEEAPPATLEEAMALLHARDERISELESTMAGGELEEEPQDEIEAALSQAASTAELDMGPEGDPVAPEEIPTEPAATVPDPFKRRKLGTRKSLPPKRPPGNVGRPDMQRSSILVDPAGNGALIPREDLEQLGW